MKLLLVLFIAMMANCSTDLNSVNFYLKHVEKDKWLNCMNPTLPDLDPNRLNQTMTNHARYEGCKRQGLQQIEDDMNQDERVDVVIRCLHAHLIPFQPCSFPFGFPSTSTLIQFYTILDGTTDYQFLLEHPSQSQSSWSVLDHIRHDSQAIIGGHLKCSIYDLVEAHRSVDLCLMRLSRVMLLNMSFERSACKILEEVDTCVQENLNSCCMDPNGSLLPEWSYFYTVQFVTQHLSQYFPYEHQYDCPVKVSDRYPQLESMTDLATLVNLYEDIEEQSFYQALMEIPDYSEDGITREKFIHDTDTRFVLLVSIVVFISVIGIFVLVALVFCKQSLGLCQNDKGKTQDRLRDVEMNLMPSGRPHAQKREIDEQ